MNIDLVFNNVEYGSTESKWDLKPLLFVGGSDHNVRKVNQKISEGSLGAIQNERVELVAKFHETLSSKIESGVSRYTIRGKLHHLRVFYSWGDTQGYDFNVKNVAEKFIEWTAYLLYRTRNLNEITAKSAHGIASSVGSLIEETLGITNVTHRSRVQKPKVKKKVLGTNADKQLLAETFDFGQFLCTLVENLTVERIQDRLPLTIEIEGLPKLIEWSGLKPEDMAITTASATRKKSYLKKVLAKREHWQSDNSWRTRYPLMNLRIEAEMLIFISQTGMNVAQTHKLKRGSFRYASHNNGYVVKRIYKSRAGGELEFEIFSEYRVFFDRYLKWLAELYPIEDDDRLFPLRSPKYSSVEALPNFERIRDRCYEVGLRYIGPRELRKTRINWLIRKTQDIALVAEIAQNSTGTLMTSYERPHHQLATAEITRFHHKNETARKAPSPGICSKPSDESAIASIEDGITPNCVNPAGCLFCDHHRDIETFDYIWSLRTYKQYQVQLITSQKTKPHESNYGKSPPERTIERITRKLDAFTAKDALVQSWVDESNERVLEGDYHPQWDIFIRLLELQ
ncbi:hypothetical protein ACQJ0O_18330 [Pseudomonas shirazensis]|uniref:hypothetical protein n=1 Tax=Pseudomonas shirazensis TaxID=2745494 RepID=UPI003D01444F